MQADRVRPGREGGREEGEGGTVLEGASSFHRFISLSLSLSLSRSLWVTLPSASTRNRHVSLRQMEGRLCPEMMMMPFNYSYRNKNVPTAIYPSLGYSPPQKEKEAYVMMPPP
jgi:hypothetical protein